MDKRKEQEIIDVLLTPIKCTGKSHGTPNICLKNSVIETTQTYYSSCLDEDMSDFAVGFYEILYKEILDEQKMLDTSGMLNNCCFAGDTMNSFHSIANVTPGAGKSKKRRTPEDLWSDELRKYKTQYHCLANFWIIPMRIGRTSMKQNHFDSMDFFVDSLKTDYETVLKKHKDYLAKINSYDSFVSTHFLDAYIPTDSIKYCEKNGFRLIEQATDRIKKRAADLAKSKYSDELWEYFSKLGLYDSHPY